MLGSFKMKCGRAQTRTENVKYDVKCGKKGSRHSLPATREYLQLPVWQFEFDVV